MANGVVCDRMMTMDPGGLEIAHLENVVPMGPVGPTDRFAATDAKLDRRVAVRVLPPIGSGDDGTRFVDRARALAGVSRHPNIVTVLDAGITADERPFLITELVDGTDLADRIATGGPLPWAEATDLILQLADGLEQIHQGGGRHRDLRPENVLVVGSSARLTEVGLVPGPEPLDEPATLAHRAPETIDGDGDQRSDLYSLTSLLYFMIDGRGPYWRPNDTTEAFLARLRNQSAPPLDPELVPTALAVFVTAGLSSDPFDRPQHVGEFIAELRAIVEGRTTGSTPSVLHRMSGSVPVVAAATAPTTVAPMATALSTPGTEHEVPSWSFDTAELTATDGLPLNQATAWAPPGPAPEPTMEPASIDATTVASFAPPGAASTVGPAGLAEPLGSSTGEASFPAPTSGVPRATGGIEPPTQSTDPFAYGAVAPDDQTTLIPTFEPAPEPRGEQERRPILLVAAAMIAIGLVGLMAALAVGLRGSDDSGEVTAPLLPDPNAPTEAGAAPGDGSASPTTLTPLAMLPSSTTTTVSDEMVTSTDTTVRRVVVPELVALDASVAGQRLSDLGFEVLVVGRVSPGSVPGTVIQQTPAAGATIELPATVTLFIPRSATLPAMVGRPADTVCLQLNALGLQCEQTLRFDERVAPGAVIATTPTEGSAFTDGQTIRIEVSRGPLTEARIPPVTGLSEEDARAALGQAGFVAINVVSVASNDVPAGQAIGTDPAPGTSLTIDQPVTIQISSGPAPMVAVPDLAGLDRAAAEAALQQAQLTGSFVTRDLPADDPGIGRVVAVDPATGTQVAVGSTVTVTIGQVAESTSTTAPSMTTTTMAAGDG